MAKGLPGSTLGQGSFFEVQENRTVRLRETEMNGHFCLAEPAPTLKTRYKLRPGARSLRARQLL